MITKESMLEDNFNDNVLIAIRLLNTETKWTNKKYCLQNKLIEILESEGYIAFGVTNPNRYQLSKVGQSYLYDVPKNRRGHLSIFRGKRVRIVCTYSGSHTWRGLMANVVGDK